ASERALGAPMRVREADGNVHLVILAAHRRILSAAAATALATGEPGEEVGQVHLVEWPPGVGETRRPFRRRPELLAAAVPAELIVRRTLFRILERGVRFADLLE